MKKILFLGLTGLAFFGVTKANAADITVDAFLSAQQAVSLTKTTDMQFGNIAYTGAPTGAVQLGTNGTRSLSGGSTNITLNAGVVNAGVVAATGDGTSTVDISCETGGTLSNGSGSILSLGATEVSIVGAAFGAGSACAGLATPSTTNNFSVTAAPNIRMGGAVTVTGIAAAGAYSTTAAGGDPVTLRVVYQ